MRVIVIPDVHLKPHIFEKASQYIDEGRADRAVCLMDIADDFRQEFNLDLYKKTYDAAIRFAKAHQDTLWCWGNHDMSYIWERLETGFSPYAIDIVRTKLSRLRSELHSPEDIAFVHRIDNVIFVHGGISQRFVKKNIPEYKTLDTDEIIGKINSMDRDILWDDASPLWFRPQYTDDEMFMEHEMTQVVGHTPVSKINKRGNVISCDVFSTHPDGTPIGTCEYVIIDTLTGEYITTT